MRVCEPSRNTKCVIIRPSRANRLANACPGVCVVALSFLPLLLGQGSPALVFLAVPGLILTVRGYDLSAETRQGKLTVHGYLRSRTVPRSAIIEITDSSTVVWTDGKGRSHRTPIWAFSTQPGMLTSVAKRHAESRRQLRRWARGV